jgi:hypothetical protein
MNRTKYIEESYNAKRNAQANLAGRSHFVDDDTLRFFAGRVLSAYDAADGRLFVVVHSQKRGRDDYSREFGYAIFDLAGTVIAHSSDKFKTGATARKHCAAALHEIDAEQATAAAIEHVRFWNQSDTRWAETYWNEVAVSHAA